MTTLEELRRQIAVLACVEETKAPFVSCYLNLEQGEDNYRMAFEDRAAPLSAFIECEEQESQAVAARFVQSIRTQGRLPAALLVEPTANAVIAVVVEETVTGIWR